MANVLIVDDDVDTADACRELLEFAGHHIRIVHNGEEGLASLSADTLPDCVLLDLDMPVLNGEGMARQMLLRGAGAEAIPILLVSGRSDLPAVAAQIGTPYFIAKASTDYCDVVLNILDRALVERRGPAAA